jgi:phenylalanyl-tRNA synthetase beta chain
MFISYNWLKKYIPEIETIKPEDIAKKVSWSLAEVEKIEERGKYLENIVVGEIIKVENHPEEAKLAIAKVRVGENKEIEVVFAGSNKEFVKPGSRYPVCLENGTVYDADGKPKKIVKTELKGIVSEGMLCSLAEIGLSTEKKGISLIEDNLPVGTDLTPLLKDYIFEVENKSITHRPDCFSHRGIAREISAMFDLDFVEHTPQDIITNLKNKIKVTVLADDVCSRFTCIAMSDVQVSGSPTWLKIALYNLGLTPINNIVDISNYIMLDIGQPMHIYDYDKLDTKEIIVRKAKKGEKAETINHKSYELKPTHLLITTNKSIEGIAGIMGGVSSEVNEKTKNILIEAANFDMFNIRKTGLELGLQTDASIRYSRGLTNTLTKEAALNAIKLVEDICGAEISSDLTDKVIVKESDKVLEFDLNNIKRLGGVTIEKTKIVRILNSLHIQVSGSEKLPSDLNKIPNAIVNLTIPVYRKDLNISQDIVEEVIRIYGYENVKPTLPTKTISAAPTNRDYEFTYLCKQALVNNNFDEIYTYSFVGTKTYQMSGLKTTQLIKVINAIAPELEFFRDNLLPGIIEKVELNTTTYDNFGYFEIGKALRKSTQDIPLHEKKIAVLNYDKNLNSTESMKQKMDAFLNRIHLKNYTLVNLYNLKKLKISEEDSEALKVFHPNQTALVVYKDKIIGYLGTINPLIKNNYGFDGNISLAYFDYNFLFDIYSTLKPEYKPLNYFPKVSRDVSYKLIADKFDIGMIIEDIKANIVMQNDININVEFVDLYENKEQLENYLTLRYIIQKNNGTLLENEIEQVITNINKYVETEFDLKERYKEEKVN